MKTRCIGLIALGGLLGLFADTCFLMAWRRQPQAWVRAQPFDAARWRASNAIDDGDLRRAMAKDLVQRHALDGKSRAEVIALLGDERLSAVPLSELRFELREDFGGDIDPIGCEDLVIRLDTRDLVLDAHEESWHRR